MITFPGPSAIRSIALLSLLISSLMIPVSAGDVEIDAYLGDTITLHGYSYVGDTVYLFMTGPGLPASGVSLTDISQRADQGHFTMVGVDENQAWSFIWKTSRISNEIDPGTYTVYVTNRPEDLFRLSGSYKTITVFLRESNEPKVSINAQHAYTLNPEEHTSTPRPTPVNVTTSPPALPTTIAVTATPVLTTVPVTTRAGTTPGTAAFALVCGSGLVVYLRRR